MMKDRPLIVASASEPYVHNYSVNGVTVSKGAGGVITALEPILKTTNGTWIAHGRGSADADVVDENNKIKLPQRGESYSLKRLWMSRKDFRGWYYGFSNETLWPLCHNVFERPVFYEHDWRAYEKVNHHYAEEILKEAEGTEAIIWIQDYQLSLVGRILKEKRPDLLISQFWHIPWPVSDVFQICPWRKEIIKGLLGNRLLGFQKQSDCTNFLDSVSKTLEAQIDYEHMTVTYKDSVTVVRAFPVGVDFKSIIQTSKKTKKYGKPFTKKYLTSDYEYLFIGADRLDYTKGLPERIKAIDRFLEKYPEYHKKFAYLGIMVPSRTLIKKYEDLNNEMETLVANVNYKYRSPKWEPITIIKDSLPHTELYNLYKSSNAALITSLADGMNLVAKEYVAAGPDNGVLILSYQAGAAQELIDAVIINPYDIERLADSIKLAIEMPEKERIVRMERMREIISNQNVYRWAGKFLAKLIELNSRNK
jgi:trehalose 6-phosphate synthase